MLTNDVSYESVTKGGKSFIEDWNLLTGKNPSPQVILDSGALFVLSAALERRVWTSSQQSPCFANTFWIACAPPGVGKGIMLRPSKRLLRFHKRKNLKADIESEESHKRVIDVLLSLQGSENRSMVENEDDKPIIRVAPDSTSFERFVELLAAAQCVHTIKNPVPGGKISYVHRSMCFCLEELSSLFKRGYNNINKVMLTMYDCEDYTHSIRSGGTFNIIRPCVSFMAGTTPSSLCECLSDSAVDDGLTSRIFFVYAEKHKFPFFKLPTATMEEIEAEYRLLVWLRRLYDVYGFIDFDEETSNFLTDYFVNVRPRKGNVNTSPKLQNFYARYNLHVMKLSMLFHFARSTSLTMNMQDATDALAFLERIEVDMHKPLILVTRNPQANIAYRIVQYLQHQGPQTRSDIIQRFYSDADTGTIEMAINYLENIAKFIKEHREPSSPTKYKVVNPHELTTAQKQIFDALRSKVEPELNGHEVNRTESNLL